MKKIMAVAGLGIVAGAVALAGPAHAHHNAPVVQVTEGDCGAVTITTAWPEDSHLVDTARLVVQSGGEQHTAPIGEPLEIDPTEDETATIRWRIWGGGERGYDSPALDDLAALVAHLDAGGDVLDVDAPGVAWHELTVEGCPRPPADDEDPGEDPGEETPGDETPGDEQPGDQDDQPAPGAGGGQELPKTGVPALALVVVGLAALVVGGGLTLVRRRATIG